MAPRKKKTREMSDEHKAALAEGRTQGRAVRVYLEALAANKPKRGRKRTPDSVKRRLATIRPRTSPAAKRVWMRCWVTPSCSAACREVISTLRYRPSLGLLIYWSKQALLSTQLPPPLPDTERSRKDCTPRPLCMCT